MNTELANTAGEMLISEVTGYISELVPVDVEKLKSMLSTILLKYHVKKVESGEVHSDLTDNLNLFLASKKLEGLSPTTLDGYRLELQIFTDKVKKHAKDITSADIRVFLSQFPHLKTIQELLVHSSPDTTLRYARITEERKREQY